VLHAVLQLLVLHPVLLVLHAVLQLLVVLHALLQLLPSLLPLSKLFGKWMFRLDAKGLASCDSYQPLLEETQAAAVFVCAELVGQCMPDDSQWLQLGCSV
jgi:hypothetical protein